MKKPQSNHPPWQKPQIVPNGYWTFWFVASIDGCIAGVVIAIYWWLKSRSVLGLLLGAICILVGIVDAVYYWRLSRKM